MNDLGFGGFTEPGCLFGNIIFSPAKNGPERGQALSCFVLVGGVKVNLKTALSGNGDQGFFGLQDLFHPFRLFLPNFKDHIEAIALIVPALPGLGEGKGFLQIIHEEGLPDLATGQDIQHGIQEDQHTKGPGIDYTGLPELG